MEKKEICEKKICFIFTCILQFVHATTLQLVLETICKMVLGIELHVTISFDKRQNFQ